MNESKDYEFIGIDPNGVTRVWGGGPTKDVAETECRRAAHEYVQRRPDTRPLDRWQFELTPPPQEKKR